MRVDRLRLENFKCYGTADLVLERGVTVVHGVNGSGKSTLLEAVFFALYGSKALDDRTLDDVITTGEEAAEVECWFTHDGHAYRLERHLKLRGERAATTKCVLETPSESIEGARDVRREITHLLRMDAGAFVNCAYVRQGEVNKLIHASPGERQDMIDDLLQLGALEEYRERANDARLGVDDVLREIRGEANTIESQIEAKAEKGLHERLNDLESRRSEVAAEIERFEEQRDRAQRTLENAAELLERHEETSEEIDRLDGEIDDLRSKLAETETDRERAMERIRARRAEREALTEEREELLADVDLDGESVTERIDTLSERDEALRDDLEDVRVSITEATGEVERLREEADEHERQAETARSERDELASKLEADEEAIEDGEQRLADLDEEIEADRAAFADAPIAFGEAADHHEELQAEREQIQEAINDVAAEIRSTEDAIEEGERLLEEGKCPECGQPVENSPHVDVLDERREELAELTARRAEREEERDELDRRIERTETLLEAERRVDRLEERRADAKELLEQRRESVADRRERLETLEDDATAHDEEAETKRAQAEALAETVADRRGELGGINAERARIRDCLETLRRIAEIDDERDSIERELETLRERRDDWETMNDERRAQLAEKRDRKRELESAFDDERVETAREDKRRAETYLENVGEKLDELDERREELSNAIGGVRNELAELDGLRERLETVAARREELESLYEEAETLQATYGELRAELRRRNVDTLERLLNETFELVYRNDAYSGIDLDDEYRLTVYQKDGESLEPEQLSGGERALFNLSLRCAIYRLLAEGVEGAAPMPPLILDEPTVFLDSGHVTQLVSLIESMRRLGVEQIVVVSHDEELVGAADEIVRVEKDATTNRSRLDRGEPSAALLEAE